MLNQNKFSRKANLLNQTSIVRLVFLIALLNVSAFKADNPLTELPSQQSPNLSSSSGMIKVGLTDIPEKESFSLEYSIKEQAYLKLLERDILPYLKRQSKKAPICFISYAHGDHYHEYWVKRFSEMLHKAGIQVLLDSWVIKRGNILNEFVRKIEDADWVLVVGTKLYLEKYNKRAADSKEKEHVARLEGQLIEYLVRYNTDRGNKVIPILLEGTPEESLPFMLRHKVSSGFTQNDYFEELLKLIHDLYNIDNQDRYFEGIIEKFRKYAIAAGEHITVEERKAYEEKRTAEILELDKIISKDIDLYKEEAFKITEISSLNTSLEGEITSIRSELVIPAKPSFLERPKLIAAIDDKLKAQQGIQIIALAGIGGVGKTTLARQYARLQKDPVVWEINAETHENIIRSFETLAYQLVTTKRDHEELEKIKDINKDQEKEERLIAYIKNKLRVLKSWFLVYDNANKLSEVEKFLPNYPKIWGNGKIIITTRDANIQTNHHISHVLQIKKLTQKECLDLFLKIMYKEDIKSIRPTTKEQTSRFINNIPPFPLDINTAAYYVKNTKTTYNNYLNLLKENEGEFLQTQERILANASNYPWARYSIIQLSLDNIMNENPEFIELLLVTSLVGSQNIPRFLLERYKKNHLVDAYIYHLSKHSLITEGSSSTSNPYPVFSIHRSIQEIMLDYLIKKLGKEKFNKSLKEVSLILEKQLFDSEAQEVYPNIRLLINHGEAFLARKNLLPDELQAYISCTLAGLYIRLNQYVKAANILEECLKLLIRLTCAKLVPKVRSKIRYKTIMVLVFQGIVKAKVGNYQAAKQPISQGIELCKKYFPKDYHRLAWGYFQLACAYMSLGEYREVKRLLAEVCTNYYAKCNFTDKTPVYITNTRAMIFMTLGSVYTELGEYKNAIKLLEEIRFFYNNYPSKDFFKVIAWNLGHLGNAYEKVGKYDTAKNLIEESKKIYTEHLPGNHVELAWFFIQLGKIVTEMGHYKEAQNLLEKALTISTKYLSEHHVQIALAQQHLGNVYRYLGNFNAAKRLLEQSLLGSQENYGKGHVKTAQFLGSLGLLYKQSNDLVQAENLLKEALEIFQASNHPEQYTVLESLAEIFQDKFLLAKAQGNFPLSQEFRQQAQNYLQQALDILKVHFPEDSPHIPRLTLKIKKLE